MFPIRIKTGRAVKPDDLILVGGWHGDLEESTKYFREKGIPWSRELTVVTTVYIEEFNGADAEVVYWDGRHFIFRDVSFTDFGWGYTHGDPNGGYADSVPRFQKFIGTLRYARSRRDEGCQFEYVED